MNYRYLLGLFFALGFCSTQAVAGVITDVEVIDSYVGYWQSASWTHDLSDQAFTPGSAVGGALTIEFSDDGVRDFFGLLPDLGEVATIVVGIIDFQDGELFYTPTSDWAGNIGINSLASLNSDGKLDVKVWSDFGDFYVGNSILEVTTSVPEPSILGLLGMGLLAFGAVRSRRSEVA